MSARRPQNVWNQWQISLMLGSPTINNSHASSSIWNSWSRNSSIMATQACICVLTTIVATWVQGSELESKSSFKAFFGLCIIIVLEFTTWWLWAFALPVFIIMMWFLSSLSLSLHSCHHFEVNGGRSTELCLEYSVLGIYLYWLQKPINPGFETQMW